GDAETIPVSLHPPPEDLLRALAAQRRRGGCDAAVVASIALDGGRRVREAILHELEHAFVDDLGAVVVTHDEERREVDPEACAELHPRGARVVFIGPHHLVDAIPEPALFEKIFGLATLAARAAVGEAFLDHRDVHSREGSLGARYSLRAADDARFDGAA